MTYGSQLHVCGDAVLPGKAEDVGQVEGEVDDATAGGCQVGLVEEHAHKETLHDGGDSEGQQEEEDNDGVAVIQHLSTLRHEKEDIYYATIPNVICTYKLKEIAVNKHRCWAINTLEN